MRNITTLLLCGLLLGCGKGNPSGSIGQRLQTATAKLKAAGSSPELRFYALPGAAKESFAAGKIEDAKKYAAEVMGMLPSFQGNRYYPVALHDGNMVLGRIAVREGRIEDAKRYLIEAGQTPGSSALMNYGPNMSLAKDLLEKGERQAVLDYFDLIKKIWTTDSGRLEHWKQQVSNGKVPDFGPNLFY